jgi:hypothetical protein
MIAFDDITLPQYFLAWAWHLNYRANCSVDASASSYSLRCGISEVIGAQKAIAHARLLMAGVEKIAA